LELVPANQHVRDYNAAVQEERMADSDGGARGAIELAQSATPVARRRFAALAPVARPAGGVAALLLVEVLRSPRARAAALGLARSLARRLAGQSPVPSASVAVSATAWRVTVAEESGVGVASVLVRGVETALALPDREQPPAEP
jgi:hypothetical protein